jgi:hypothetical protein
MDRGMIKAKPARRGEPHLDLLALVHLEIVQDPMNERDLRRNIPIQHFQKLAEFDLPLALVALAVDLSAAGVKRGKEVQGPRALLLMCHAHRLPGTGRPGRRLAGTGWERGFLVDTEDFLRRTQRPRIQVAERPDAGAKRLVTRHFRTQPEVLTPRLQLRMIQHAAHGLG